MSRIKKKAHLGDRKLTSVTVPADITTIEDWAYAHCKNLRQIYIPTGIASISQKSFEGCDSLSEVFLYEGDIEHVANDSSHLLALAVNAWPDDAESMIVSAKSSKEFYKTFDKRLNKYLAEPDEVGFDPFLAGGEEDYEDEANDIDCFKYNKQIAKCTLIYERMLSVAAGHKIALEHESVYIDYIKEHKRESAFDALIKDDVYSMKYRALFFELVELDDNDIEALMEPASKDVELQSMLIGVSLENKSAGFDKFEL